MNENCLFEVKKLSDAGWSGERIPVYAVIDGGKGIRFLMFDAGEWVLRDCIRYTPKIFGNS